MRKIIVCICIFISLISLVLVFQIKEAYDYSKIGLPKYLDVEKSDLEKLEKDTLIKIAHVGFLEAKNMRDALLKSVDNSSKLLIGISLLMLIQVLILSIYVLKPLNKANSAKEKTRAD